MDTRHRVGANIRSVRRLRGISADKLARSLAEKTETDISGDAILLYETGKRPVSVEMLFAIADVLNCSVQALLDGADARLGEVPERTREIGRLSPEDHNILRDVATRFEGDTHALIIAVGIYITLPPHRRREAMMDLLAQMDIAMREGELKANDLPRGLLYLQSKIGELF